MKKFMMTISSKILYVLEVQADERGVTVQELVRAVILPEWFKKQGARQNSAQSGETT